MCVRFAFAGADRRAGNGKGRQRLGGGSIGVRPQVVDQDGTGEGAGVAEAGVVMPDALPGQSGELSDRLARGYHCSTSKPRDSTTAHTAADPRLAIGAGGRSSAVNRTIDADLSLHLQMIRPARFGVNRP